MGVGGNDTVGVVVVVVGKSVRPRKHTHEIYKFYHTRG